LTIPLRGECYGHSHADPENLRPADVPLDYWRQHYGGIFRSNALPPPICQLCQHVNPPQHTDHDHLLPAVAPPA
jgi:hypothetical protein